jgi:NAD(P)-dependent dehydrogenase (short-subunit alcohol dehydrogenase family)
MIDLAGRTAVVTGAARGIGLGIARRLAEQGASVVMTDVLQDPLDEAAADLRREGRSIKTISIDLTTTGAGQQILDAAVSISGKVDILVNNAGIGISGTLEEFTDEQWDHTIAVNLTAPFRLARAIVPAMAARGWGRVINISSMNASMGMRGDTAYAASKAGLEALTREIAADYGASGVTANTIAPGTIETPLNRDILESQDPDSPMMRIVVHNKPILGNGRPDDIAAAVAFLASEEARFISGQLLFVDGGLVNTRFVPDGPNTKPFRYLPKN